MWIERAKVAGTLPGRPLRSLAGLYGTLVSRRAAAMNAHV